MRLCLAFIRDRLRISFLCRLVLQPLLKKKGNAEGKKGTAWTMDLEDEEAWQSSFTNFMAGFGRFFKRTESRENAACYVRGLLADLKRKTCWQVAEVIGEAGPDGWIAAVVVPSGMGRQCSVSAATEGRHGAGRL